jgi:hypothetical protein
MHDVDVETANVDRGHAYHKNVSYFVRLVKIQKKKKKRLKTKYDLWTAEYKC